MEECYVCRKHGAMSVIPGGEISADEHVVVSHLPLTTPMGCSAEVELGHLLVEPRRHVEGLGDLTPEEAASLGRLAAAASSALQRSEAARHVSASVGARAGEHLQLHLLPRHDEATDAPRGDAAAVAALAQRLRGAQG
jgi:diadenosine tetraphosphate (Ap4A) HIT family hydrolase